MIEDSKKYAGIEYHGASGLTKNCLDAISRLIQFGNNITAAKLLSSGDKPCQTHAFIFEVDHGDIVAIKPGFASGYGGAGPKGLADALMLLSKFEVDIEEYEVAESVMKRLSASCLLVKDMKNLSVMKPVRPQYWSDYIYVYYPDWIASNVDLKHRFPVVIPYHILDSRLFDLALKFDAEPDVTLITAFKRLEDIVRKRTNSKDSGSKLFSKAFVGDRSILSWNGTEDGEHVGRGNLFSATFSAFRNPRAHKELDFSLTEGLREFLLINELFILESKSIARESNLVDE